MSADGSFVPKNRLSCRCPAARPVRPARSARSARNFPETKKIICPAHAAHVGHMMGDLVQSFPCFPRPPSSREGDRPQAVEGVRSPFTRLRKTGESSSADDGTRSARPRGLGGDFEFLPLKSPRNPITPFETSRVATLHPELYTRFREGAEYRRARDARPYNVAENCNCEMCLQRRVASLQPSVAPPSPVGARIARPFISDVITTLRAGARRVIGATAKPLYPIDGKAEGLDRRSPRPPSSREGDHPQVVEGVNEGGGRSSAGGRRSGVSLAERPSTNAYVL